MTYQIKDMGTEEEFQDGRTPASSNEWDEIFLNPGQAARTGGTLEAIFESHSVLLLHSLAAASECEPLRAEAMSVAQVELEERVALEEMGLLDEVLDSHTAGRVRMPVSERLGPEAQALCDRILLRALSAVSSMGTQVGEAMPRDMKLTVADCIATSSCLESERLCWSPGEPAVNVYTTGGEFKPHKDEQSLTVLVPLTDDADFSGGGTAFWASDGCGADEDGSPLACAPAMVLKPPTGAAMLFGGAVTHAAQPVITGVRCVFVASFSPRTDDEG